jgi:hypothetical protein
MLFYLIEPLPKCLITVIIYILYELEQELNPQQ